MIRGVHLSAIAVAALCAALAGCGTPSGPVTLVTKTVEVPVPVPCAADPGASPAFPDTAAAIRAAPDIFARAQLYAAGRQLRLLWEAQLSAALEGCKTPSPAKLGLP